MSAHTPGPWEAIGNLVRSPMDKESGSGVMLAECADRWFLKVNSDEAKANARLIAAAPELLEALQNLLAVAGVRIDDPRIVQFDAARAAVAKATGEAK
jgi:hypothetical protein